jgi:hypothetical protein
MHSLLSFCCVAAFYTTDFRVAFILDLISDFLGKHFRKYCANYWSSDFVIYQVWLIDNYGSLALLFIVSSWKLTLVILGVVPAIVIISVVYMRFVEKISKQIQDLLGMNIKLIPRMQVISILFVHFLLIISFGIFMDYLLLLLFIENSYSI